MRRERFSSRVLMLALFVGTACSGLAFSQSLTVIYNFSGPPDGAQPASGLFQDSSGTLYGTTSAGGTNNLGTVFKMNRSGNESVVYSFAALPDGNQPFNSIPARDQNGNLYGATIFGGRNNYGTIYKITPTGQESVVYSFCSLAFCADGEYPYGTLIIGPDGNLYGTAYNGGPSNQGLVYKITPSGQQTVLYNFTGQADGGSPYGSLLPDRNGNFYGTTSQGGTFNAGVVYKLAPGQQETVIHNFGDGNDGAVPFGGLTFDAFGNIYGTTLFGGTSANGTVFKITSMGAYSVLHNFAGGTDGSNPYTTLVPIPSASLGVTTFYGTTDGDGSGSGTIYKITSNGQYSVVYNFTGGNDGSEPDGQLLLVPSSSFRGGMSFYGTALGGGSSGFGVVFRLAL